MSAQHTPGPWIAVRNGFHCVAVKNSRGGFLTYEAGDFCTKSGEKEANARLIAAAPDLPAFAQSLIDDYCSDDGMASAKHIVKLAQEVVAKATGGEA